MIALPLGKVADFRAELGPDFELDADMLREALRHATCANGSSVRGAT